MVFLEVEETQILEIEDEIIIEVQEKVEADEVTADEVFLLVVLKEDEVMVQEIVVVEAKIEVLTDKEAHREEKVEVVMVIEVLHQAMVEEALGAGGVLIEGIRRGCGRNLCAGHEKAGGL